MSIVCDERPDPSLRRNQAFELKLSYFLNKLQIKTEIASSEIAAAKYSAFLPNWNMPSLNL